MARVNFNIFSSDYLKTKERVLMILKVFKIGVQKWVLLICLLTLTPTPMVYAQAEIMCIMTREGRIKEY